MAASCDSLINKCQCHRGHLPVSGCSGIFCRAATNRQCSVFSQARPTATRMLGHHWLPPCRELITFKAGWADKGSSWHETGWQQWALRKRNKHTASYSCSPRLSRACPGNPGHPLGCGSAIYPISKWARVRRTYLPWRWAYVSFPQIRASLWILPAVAPDVTVAIKGVFLFSLTFAKNLKRSPSSAIA